MATYKLITDRLNTYFTNNKITIGTAAPTSGTHAAGDIVLSSSANSTAFGWICTAAGTPGTWKVLKSGSDVTSVSGNAGTATKFASAQSVALTGDVTGSASSQAGWSVATTLANSGVTAGSYGPSAAASPAHGGTFSVPYITVDAKGRVTSASTKTITLPSDNNTDTKVTNTLATTTKAYVTGTTTASTNTGTQVFDTGVYLDTTAGQLTATTFKGALSGNASTATKLATARTISLSGAVSGSGSFDGSGNLAINTSKQIFAGSGTSGTSGYVAFAQLVITNTHVNRPIEFELICRGKSTPCYVSIAFSNTKTTDPSLSSLYYWGSDYGVFAHKTDTSTWLLYYTKSESYDTVTLIENNYASQGVTITYPGTFITTKPTSNVTNASLGGYMGYANRFASAQSVALTGDVTGSASSQAGWSVATTLANSGVTAGSYGPSANASPAHSGTFSVPYITVDAKGRVTSASTKTITLPSDNNTDTKVTNTLATTTKAYVTGTTSSSTNTGTQVFDTGVYLDTTAGKLVATTFSGSLSGNASTATKLATARTLTIGSTGKTFDGSGNVSWTLSEIGAAASSHSHSVLTTKGTNTITSTTDDTTANWGTQGHSVHWYTATGQLIDQPGQWGYLVNIGTSSEVHQLWMTQSSGSILHRGGNSSGWNGSWRTLLDSSNYSSYALPLSGGTMTGVLTTPNLVTQGISLKGANGNDTEAHPFVFYDDSGSGWFVPADKPGFHVGDQGCGLYFCGSNISFCYFSDDTTISSLNDEDGVEAMCSPDNIGKRKPDAIYNVYHEGFNPTPEAVGALSIEGGTVTGETTFESTVTADTIYSTNAINISSDRNLKEDIKYISPSNVNLLNEENNSDNISLKDMYDFVKDELGLASYIMKNDKESKKKINFIAQDLLYNNNNEDSKVGQLIVNAEHAVNNDTTLSYDLGNYNSIIAGALQYAIKEIENLKAEIEELKSK